MRKESEVLKNIIDIAEADDNVRAVIRTNLLPIREYLYSYQFYFIVRDISKFEDDSVFETSLGERILLFRADKNYPEMFHNTKAHLMVYRDGITIVINAMDYASFLKKYNGEVAHENAWIGDTYKKILDKDNLLLNIERLDETQTVFSSNPTEEEFVGTCNEFWWVLKTFAEYSLRKELPSAMFYLNVPVRDLLNRMIRWHIYIQHGEPVDIGILDSNMEILLEDNLFELYKKTFSSADFEQIWKAYDAVTELWSHLGKTIAKKSGFRYPKDTEKDMKEFITKLRVSEL